MLKEAFQELSPRILERYRSFLGRSLPADPKLRSLHDLYSEYTCRDINFPRPILTFFGRFHREERVSFDSLDEIGPPLFISQILRDFLAIHDDIVDEDIIKFDKPALPVLYSTDEMGPLSYLSANLSKQGKDLALYYGDLLVGMIYKTLEGAPQASMNELLKLVNDTIMLNQTGQLRELLLQKKDIKSLDVDEIVQIYVLKASYYCYSFPFEVGLALSGASKALQEKSRSLLLRLGAASQIVDDVVGVFPDLFNHGKDTVGELIHLRRTIPLILLSKKLDSGDEILEILNHTVAISNDEAKRIKIEMYKRGILEETAALMKKTVQGLPGEIETLPVGSATKEYLKDLLESRVMANAQKFIGVANAN